MTQSALTQEADDPRRSLAQIVDRCYSELKSYARLKVGDEATAEELVQEACLRLAATGGNMPFNPRAFLYRVLSNLVVDHHRSRARSTRHFVVADNIDAVDDRPSAERHLIARQRLAILMQAVKELPPRCQECFVLRRFEGLSHAEIAERMNITRSAVEKHLAMATVHCARRLKAHE